MLDILQLRLDCRDLGSVLQDEVIKVFVVVDLVNEVIDAWWGLRSTAFKWLWTDNLAVVDNQLLVE